MARVWKKELNVENEKEQLAEAPLTEDPVEEVQEEEEFRKTFNKTKNGKACGPSAVAV